MTTDVEALPPSSAEKEPSAGRVTALLAAYAVLSLAFVLPSARLWLQRPMTLTAYEFDYFLGAFWTRDLETALAFLQAGRLIHLLGFLLIGGLFVAIVRRLVVTPDLLPLRRIVFFSAVLSLVWTLGLPWVSPDVFFYIGGGWLDGHYGLSPYWHAITEVPGYRSDPMFRNVLPFFLGNSTSYGPSFQLVARAVALASGGSEVAALALFKGINLVIHAACCALVFRLAPAPSRRALLFFYACNPLILFSILTCAHNDHLMNLCVLAAFLLRERGRPALSGLALAVAVSFKYVPVILVPLFAVDLLVSSKPSSRAARLLALARLSAPFLIGAAVVQVAYPDSVRRFFLTVTNGIGGTRESLHYLVPWTRILFPDAHMPQRTTLIALLLGLYVACLVVFVWRARREGTFRLAEAAVWVLLVYFIVLNETNQEWYLTWILGPLTLIGIRPALTFGLRLSWLFLPLVIFTVRSSIFVIFVSNSALYLLLLGLSVPLLYHLLRGINVEAERPPVL